jgi:hypothetical protein
MMIKESYGETLKKNEEDKASMQEKIKESIKKDIKIKQLEI